MSHSPTVAQAREKIMEHDWADKHDPRLARWPALREWTPDGMSICLMCGVIKRADGLNRPCKGPTTIDFRTVANRALGGVTVEEIKERLLLGTAALGATRSNESRIADLVDALIAAVASSVRAEQADEVARWQAVARAHGDDAQRLAAELVRAEQGHPVITGNDLAVVMRAIRPLDCGALHCRYCRAGSNNQWQHDEYCLYDQSVKDADRAREIIVALRVQMAEQGHPQQQAEDHGAGLIGHVASPVAETEPRLNIPVTAEELDWVQHAANLRHLSAVEYVRRAINLSLCKEGVDAVLLAESED